MPSGERRMPMGAMAAGRVGGGAGQSPQSHGTAGALRSPAAAAAAAPGRLHARGREQHRLYPGQAEAEPAPRTGHVPLPPGSAPPPGVRRVLPLPAEFIHGSTHGPSPAGSHELGGLGWFFPYLPLGSRCGRSPQRRGRGRCSARGAGPRARAWTRARPAGREFCDGNCCWYKLLPNFWRCTVSGAEHHCWEILVTVIVAFRLPIPLFPDEFFSFSKMKQIQLSPQPSDVIKAYLA